MKVTFAQGASIDDPNRVFNASLEGGTRRAVDIAEGDVLDPGAFRALVRAAADLNASKTKSKPKSRSKSWVGLIGGCARHARHDSNPWHMPSGRCCRRRKGTRWPLSTCRTPIRGDLSWEIVPVRRSQRSEVDAVPAALARAFVDDPVCAFAWPDDARRPSKSMRPVRRWVTRSSRPSPTRAPNSRSRKLCASLCVGAAAPGVGVGEPHAHRTRGRATRERGPVEPGDRRASPHQQRHGEGPHLAHLHQARPGFPG